MNVTVITDSLYTKYLIKKYLMAYKNLIKLLLNYNEIKNFVKFFEELQLLDKSFIGNMNAFKIFLSLLDIYKDSFKLPNPSKALIHKYNEFRKTYINLQNNLINILHILEQKYKDFFSMIIEQKFITIKYHPDGFLLNFPPI